MIKRKTPKPKSPKPKSPKPKTKGTLDANSPWRVPLSIADVPEGGVHLDLAPDEGERQAIAALAGVSSLRRLAASFDVTRHGRAGLHVVGRVCATVGQSCVVTLEPLENEVDEAVDLVFVPQSRFSGQHATEVEVALEDGPETLVEGTIDLGAIATEFLMLGIDPYPRQPGTVFEAPGGRDEIAHPFAALAALKKQ